jgi:pyruvate dehydrogenase E2 component (dihydrolipoamide acetyltransferase)
MGYKLELPDIGEGVVEAEVQQWFVKPGDHVVEDQPLVEVMTDKATVTIPSPKRGTVLNLFWKVGEVAKVHSPLVELEVESAAGAADKEEAAAPAPAMARPAVAPSQPPRVVSMRPAGQRALATPAVRALARDMGVDVQAVLGSGEGGRVTKEDLQAFRSGTNGHGRRSAGMEEEAWTSEERARAVPSAAEPVTAGPDERVPLRGIRKRIAENMARSKRTAAHFTFVEQCDATELVKVKDRVAAAARQEGVKVTFLPFVMKAVVAALRKHPRLNATVDDGKGELVLHRRWDLGLASATEAGLVVPVVRGVDRRSLLDLAREVERLSADSKAGRLRPEDVGRSTFTITSLGALGGVFATPVLNYPEVGILGLHRIRPTPVVRDGQVVVRDVMHVSVTSDHRMVDGHEAAAFCYEVIRTLEDPSLLLMQMI